MEKSKMHKEALSRMRVLQEKFDLNLNIPHKNEHEDRANCACETLKPCTLAAPLCI